MKEMDGESSRVLETERMDCDLCGVNEGDGSGGDVLVGQLAQKNGGSPTHDTTPFQTAFNIYELGDGRRVAAGHCFTLYGYISKTCLVLINVDPEDPKP